MIYDVNFIAHLMLLQAIILIVLFAHFNISD
jgi:hypothetical protein